VYRTGQPVHELETRRRFENLPAGELHEEYFDLTHQPMFDAAGHIEGVMSFAVNVTERVRARQQAEALQAQMLAAAQQQAREREAFHNVFEQTPALIALLRAPEHRFEYVNPAYQALFPGRPLVGLTMAEAVPEIHDQGYLTLLDQVFQTGDTYFGAELPFASSPGGSEPPRIRYYNFTYQAYREAGQVAGISIFAFDVTEQVLARQQREAERQQLLRLFQEAPAGIAILTGPEWVYEFVNPVYQQLVPDRVLRGLPFLQALPELVNNPVTDIMQRVYASGRPHEEHALLIPVARTVHGVPEDRHFSFVYQPRFDECGHVDGLLVFVFEVTEQVRSRQRVQELNDELASINQELQATNKELGDSNQQLTRTNQDLDNFVYAASHDLKQPVNNLAGLLLELQRSVVFADPSEEELLVPMVQEALQQLSITIDDLAALGQAQQTSQGPTEWVSLDMLTEEVVNTLEPQVRAARARITTDFQARPALSFARANLRTILLNLLGNSLKYADPARPARIHVAVWVERGQPVLVVQDNGLGFDARKYGKELFHLFRRLHTHTAGTGVGLYLVSRIVEANGGAIEVDSQPGKGATFRIRFGAA
jgi:signal transduction histidine kinase